MWAGDAMHRQPGIQAAAPADLDHVAKRVGVGRLADDTGVQPFAVRLQPVEYPASAVDRLAFFIPCDEQG